MVANWMYFQQTKVSHDSILPRKLFRGYSQYLSVRGAQYIPDITVNAKIPEEVAHKLPFERFRIWPLAFWPYP